MLKTSRVLVLVAILWVAGGESVQATADCPLSLYPDYGTMGTEITITGSDFGARTGQVYIGKWKTKILVWDDTFIRCVHVHQLLPGAYDVQVFRNGDTEPAYYCENAFTVLPPEVDTVEPAEGCPGQLMTISGWFFGSLTSKVVVYIKTETSSWVKPEVVDWTMDPVTGESRCVFKVPQAVAGLYALYVRNLVGWSNPVEFTITEPEECQVTLTRLSAFNAEPGDGAVRITWVTTAEIDNAGFNLYRARVDEGTYLRVNDSLICACGAPAAGAAYEFIDEDVENRKAYYYMLEDVDIRGTATIQAAAEATPRGIY